MSAVPDLVLLGNFLVDDIVMEDGTTLMSEPGGAMLYMSLAASLWGIRVGVVSVAGTDYPRAALDGLRGRGVDLSGVRDYGKPGVRSWLLYEPAGRQIIHRLDTAPHVEVSPMPEDIPVAWRSARAFHVAPMPLESQRRIVASLPREAFVSCDPHAPLNRDTAERWRDMFDHIDAFMPSEIELDTHGDSPEVAMRRI
jgi:sugar/nucleoside kinase (ribokinase family)